nr:MAG TPA: hypothetical protein [Caudoviricetes sp.]
MRFVQPSPIVQPFSSPQTPFFTFFNHFCNETQNFFLIFYGKMPRRAVTAADFYPGST